MNIFLVDFDLKQSAQQLPDMLLNKQILEACQVMCTNFHLLTSLSDIPYKKTHENHPITIWNRKLYKHFTYLIEYTTELLNEFTYRRNKQHKCSHVIEWINLNKNKLKLPITNKSIDFCWCVPDVYKNRNSNHVEAYRDLIKNEKRGYYRKLKNSDKKVWVPYVWSKRKVPYWFVF